MYALLYIEREHRLGQIYHVCCYLMLFVSGTHILSNRSSCPVKPTGKHLHQRLPFNKEGTLPHVFSLEIHKTLKNIPPYRAHLGAASVVTYILKMTELPPGLERKIILYLIMLDLCYQYIYTKDFC